MGMELFGVCTLTYELGNLKEHRGLTAERKTNGHESTGPRETARIQRSINEEGASRCVRRRREETKENDAGGGTGGAWARGRGCAAVGDGGRAPRAGAASPGHRGAGEGREPGAGAVGHGAQDAVQRHGAPHPGAHPPPRQGLGEARARA